MTLEDMKQKLVPQIEELAGRLTDMIKADFLITEELSFEEKIVRHVAWKIALEQHFIAAEDALTDLEQDLENFRNRRN